MVDEQNLACPHHTMSQTWTRVADVKSNTHRCIKSQQMPCLEIHIMWPKGLRLHWDLFKVDIEINTV